MGDVLYVEPGRLRSLAGEISSCGDDFSTLLGNIQEANATLAEAWQGTNATSYTNAVADQAAKMQELKKAISSVSEFLSEAASAFEQIEQNTTIQG